MNSADESVIWQGNPSNALNFWLNLSCLLLLPIPWALWRWIELRNHDITISSERVRLTTGIFDKRTEELELYRVRDTTFLQPFILRLFGKGNLTLTTTDASSPSLTLLGIPADPKLRDDLRRAIEACRDRKRARVAELGGVIDTDDSPPAK
ncbi:MAG: PH domain-containing protein [Verrucomicrobiales bacterium]|nr:PH domain-containing protein [Verrucomicrobiales bacterium]